MSELVAVQTANVLQTKSIAAHLQHVDPSARNAINAWLAARYETRFSINAREFQLSWGGMPPAHLQFGIDLGFGTHRALLAFDGLAAIDPMLVGDPFDTMPVSLRTLVVQRIVATFIAALPASLSEAADVRAVHWNIDTMPRRNCVLGLSLVRLPEGVTLRGLLAVESPETLNWLNCSLPAQEPRAGVQQNLRILLRILLGETLLAPHALRGIETGDVVWIESGRITRDGLAARLEKIDDAALRWSCYVLRNKSKLRIATQPTVEGGISMNLDRAGLEVPVTFDLGEIAVPLAEIERLQPGYLFELPHDVANATVYLRVAGSLIAEGQLVVIGRRLGVRIVGISGNGRPS